ncbi:hypothetical protein ACFLUA_03365 [Chloroflexota bacterium]
MCSIPVIHGDICGDTFAIVGADPLPLDAFGLIFVSFGMYWIIEQIIISAELRYVMDEKA